MADALPRQAFRSRLVQELLRALEEADVEWCQWKSTIDLDQAAAGTTDLDLLVARSDQPALLSVLGRLGFREADPPPEKAAIGSRSFFGFDPEVPRPIHAHVHFLLMVGSDFSKGFRLPLEREFLASSLTRGPFRVPTPELEFVVFVLRTVLKSCTLDSILRGRSRLAPRVVRELEWLEAAADPEAARRVLQGSLAAVGPDLFGCCREVLGSGVSPGRRWRTGRRLRARLAVGSPRSPLVDAASRLARTVRYRLRKARRGAAPRFAPAGGGLLVAVVGSDGAGKSTLLRSVESWLSRDLGVVQVHLGHPPWSVTTYIVRGGFKMGRILTRPFRRQGRAKQNLAASAVHPDLSWLAKQVCLARDRRRVFESAARAASRGAIVLCDRYPLAGLMAMDGPQVSQQFGEVPSGALARYAARREQRDYARIAAPDLLFVLKLPPDASLARKPEDDPERVARGSREIMSIDWSVRNGIVLDATIPAAEIALEVKRHIWRAF